MENKKTYFDIKLEALVPATISYRVLAEDAEQASALIKNMSPTSIKPRLNGKKDIKLIVYNAGSSLIKFIKNF